MSNVRLQVKDVDVNRLPGITPNTSIKEAWIIMKEKNVYTLAVTEGDKLLGVISTGDIATSYMDILDNRLLSIAKTQYKNIVHAVDGEVI